MSIGLISVIIAFYFSNTNQYSDAEIKKLREQIQFVGGGTTDIYKGKKLTVKERDETIDALNLMIGGYQTEQLARLLQAEEDFKGVIFRNTGQKVEGFRFDTFVNRPNLPSSSLPTPPTLPRTSQ